MKTSPSGPPPLRRMIVPAIFVGALFLVVFFRQPADPDAREQWIVSGRTMGTTFSVKIVAPGDPKATKEEVAAAVEKTVAEVDARMSTYRPDSELNRFNDSGTEPFEISPALLEVLTEAQRVAEISRGAFDITVGPLVDAWGFGPEGMVEPPDDATIERLLAEHGYRYLKLDEEGPTAQKTTLGLRCDLSAIAKGYGVDRVAVLLADLGFDDFMVEIGGEVRTSGVNAEGRVWRIGVERPVAQREGVWGAVELADAAMATSGDYRNYYERDGVRISHTIDARTGRPITHALASVSVIHPSCMTADALATALSVLGPEEGRRLVEQQELAALFLIRKPDGGFEEWESEDWPAANTPASGGVVLPESE
jgi:thiamine biosynthesis lipoprotein